MRIGQPRADGALRISGSPIVKRSSTPQARWESDATCVGGTGLREEALEECGEIRKFGGRAAAGLEGHAPKNLGSFSLLRSSTHPGLSHDASPSRSPMTHRQSPCLKKKRCGAERDLANEVASFEQERELAHSQS